MGIERATARLLGRLARIEWVAGLGPVLVPKGRRLTLMFTDIEGFTAYAARRGDRAAVSLLRRHDEAVLPAIKRNRGKVLKRLGDGLMVAFPTPRYAVRAGLAILKAARKARGLSVRVGIHTGRVLANRGDLVGHDVNVASRIADRARGGQVLVSEDVRQEVGDGVRAEYRAVRPLRIRGAPQIRLYEVRPRSRTPTARSAARSSSSATRTRARASASSRPAAARVTRTSPSSPAPNPWARDFT